MTIAEDMAQAERLEAFAELARASWDEHTLAAALRPGIVAAGGGPGDVVDAAPLAPPQQGLLRAAIVIEHDDEAHWGNTVSFAPASCALVTAFDPCAVTNFNPSRNRAAKVDVVPFGVTAFDECSTFGFETAEYEARARAALAARETIAVEAEWWTAAVMGTQNQRLAAGGAVGVVGVGALGLRQALAQLVQAIANSPVGVGLIHMRPYLAEIMFGLQMLRWDAQARQLVTATGHIVVPGQGYPGTGPNGEAVGAASEWMFATGPIVVHRGPVEVFAPGVTAANVDRTNNLVVSRADRLYAATFNACLLAAVQVDPTVQGP